MAAWWARWAEHCRSHPGTAGADWLAAELPGAMAALGAPWSGADAFPGAWRARAEPVLQVADAAYQRWARSDAGRQAVGTVARVGGPGGLPAAASPVSFPGLAFGLPAEGLEREMVYADGAARIYRYGQGGGGRVPLLVVYAMVNRPSILDLDARHSLIRGLVAGGRAVYLLDWGDPLAGDHQRPLADYVLGTLHRGLRAVGGRRAIDLMGVCQGGVLALCYAALEPRRVRRLVTLVTPVAFQTPDDLLSHWLRGMDLAAWEAAPPGASGAWLVALFQMLSPLRHVLAKYLDLVDHRDDPEWVIQFRRMERWVHDSPDVPARASAEFVRWFYQEDRLLQGTLELDSRRVDLRAVRAPLLNVYALQDHIVPPAAAQALCGATGSVRYDEIAVPTGHIGAFVSHRAAGVPARLDEWLCRR